MDKTGIKMWSGESSTMRSSLYRSPNIARLIKSRRLRWASHVARMEDGMWAFEMLTGKLRGNRYLGRSRGR